jgi:hypothetical protein
MPLFGRESRRPFVSQTSVRSGPDEHVPIAAIGRIGARAKVPGTAVRARPLQNRKTAQIAPRDGT